MLPAGQRYCFRLQNKKLFLPPLKTSMEELNSIITRMKDTFDGAPWYGKAVMKVLQEVDPSKVYIKPNDNSHSLIELLYHMLTWENFTLEQLQESDKLNPEAYQLLDWRETNPEIHTWNTGIAELTAAHNKIIELLENASESVLNRSVRFRDYDMRYLLKGLIEHNIYHAGQIAYLQKFLNS
jgi:uncharacterized damage-inducible protein DinB